MPVSEMGVSKIEEKNREAFEAKIGYFYGVNNRKLVVDPYIDALKKLEAIGSNSSVEILEQQIVPILEESYKSIAQQKNWTFDTHIAAQIELRIILGHANDSSFETIRDLMIQLYTHVFQSDSPYIHKAAMLRTFLYQYKADVLKREKEISQKDQIVMIEIAKTSEEFLNSIK